MNSVARNRTSDLPNLDVRSPSVDDRQRHKPMSSVKTTRTVLSAIAAGFVALMCAGPGTMILLAAAPSSAGLLGKLICPSGSKLNARWVRYSYSKPGDSNLEMTCTNEDGDPLQGHTWWF